MKMPNLGGISIVLLLVVSAFVGLAPTAAAQNGNCVGTTITLSPFGDDAQVEPLQGTTTASFDVTFRISGEANQAGLSPIGSVNIDVNPGSTPSWMTATVSPSVLTVAIDAQTREYNAGTVTAFVTTNEQAPAFQTEDFQVTVQANSSGDLCASNQASYSLAVEPQFYSVTSFRTPTTFVRTGPTDTISFPLTLVNSGNGPTWNKFEVTGSPGAWNVPTPLPMTVQASQTSEEGVNEGTVTIDISTDLSTQYYNEVGVVDIEVSSFYAVGQSNPQEPITLSLVGHFQGVYVPGFEAVGVMAALVGLALVRRRWAS